MKGGFYLEIKDLPQLGEATESDHVVSSISQKTRLISFKNIFEKISFSSLVTTAKNIIGSINELKGRCDTLDTSVSKLNTDFSNLLEVISEESSITGAVSSQTTWKNISLDKGTYLITLFLQIKASSAYRNYLTIYAQASEYYGTLPIADIYNAPENFSNMATTVIRVPNNCGLNISYYTPVSSTVAYHIYRIKQ